MICDMKYDINYIIRHITDYSNIIIESFDWSNEMNLLLNKIRKTNLLKSSLPDDIEHSSWNFHEQDWKDLKYYQSTILEVTFKEKDEAKKIGCIYDPYIKKWRVPKTGLKPEMEKWLSDKDKKNYDILKTWGLFVNKIKKEKFPVRYSQ